MAVIIFFSTAIAYASESADVVTRQITRADPIAGKSKSTLCQSCHGDRGLSMDEMIPHLAGQYAAYIAKQVHNFQSGARKNQIMNAMAATINEDDLFDIAAYFASQEKMQGGGWGKDPLARKLFLKGDTARDILPCVSCHGVNGKGKALGISTYPVIGGQRKAYLRAQLINWRAGKRTNSPGNVMNKIAKSLTDHEIEVLTNYISGL